MPDSMAASAERKRRFLPMLFTFRGMRDQHALHQFQSYYSERSKCDSRALALVVHIPPSSRLVNLLRPLVAGRRTILAGSSVAGYAPMVEWLRLLGSEGVLVIGTTVGTGTLPDASDADWEVLPGGKADPVEEFRRVEGLLRDPPIHIRDAVERFDPDRRALLLIAPFQTGRELLGRVATGSRRATWVTLEDKTLADALFDTAGIARPQSLVVRPSPPDLLAAVLKIDAGQGTVWAGDSSQGFNGGGTYVRRVKSADDNAFEEAATFFASRCAHLRVAPFLEGLPCSIHGIVVDDGVAVFRPVENIVPRDAADRFRYAGIGTFWDPAPDDRASMRDAARRIGQLLASSVGFRGSFGVDGVMTSSGFLPTEINPRYGGGMAAIGRAVNAQLPLALLHHALIHDPSLLSARYLEERLTALADGRRSGGGWLVVDQRIRDTRHLPIKYVHEGWKACRPNEPADAVLSVGPGAAGGFVRVELDADRTPTGSSISERTIAAFDYADRAFDTGIGPLISPKPVSVHHRS